MDSGLPARQKGEARMTGVVMYTTGICPFCIMAKRLFDDLGVSYQKYVLTRSQSSAST
jgi:Glutaredoxin and related proteins